MSGARGTHRDGKHREEPTPPPSTDDVLVVVSLTGDALNAALKKIEDGLLACVDAAVEAKDSAALIRLHVHLSKIGQKPRGKNDRSEPRSSVLTRAQAREVEGHFGG
jgi:hypothetical protein